MTAEKGSSEFILIDQLFREQIVKSQAAPMFVAPKQDLSDEEEDRLAKANSLLKSMNYLMYLYGPVNFSPEHFRSATHVFDPGEYFLPEVPLETGLGDMWIHVSAKYGDVPFQDKIGEIVEASLHFLMGDQTSTFTIPRTDFKDHYKADTAEYVEEKDEEARTKAREKLPSVDELVKVEHIIDLVWDAYTNSDLVSNIDNPNIPNLL